MPNSRQQDESKTNAPSDRPLTIALAGNPNSGKTTIFNAITGGRQHVGNYPGVTVEKIEGDCKHGDTSLHIVDLPGTYSLTAYSVEELVARNVLVHEKPDAVIDILDASNIERNLYLAVQIMELGSPLVLALNMSDVAKQRGLEFDLTLLSELMGVPILPTVGNKGDGMEEMLDAAISVATGQTTITPRQINYGPEIETQVGALRDLVEQAGVSVDGVPTRWIALKLLEGDTELRDHIGREDLIDAADKAAQHLESLLGDSVEALIADQRYGFISGACQEAVRSTIESRHTRSDQIDSVVTNRILGIPIFLGLMYLVFQLTFTLGSPPMGWIEEGFGWLSELISGFWPKGSESLLRSLLVDGIIGGVGGVLVFLPNILLLFLAIAVLEDSGYMARAAFLVDRLMHKIGLHGKSFVPMLIGFGCSVPAIMATRTLESRKDRLTTMLVVPLMSCGARLPIYALIIPAFFPKALNAPMLWIIYVIGIILAIICAKLLKMTVLRGETPPFVMELPPYRMPTLKSVSLHMWNRGGAYLKKAGTIILGISILLWAAGKFPEKKELDQDYDLLNEQATSAYVTQLPSLNQQMGLSQGSDLLTRAIEAELAAQDVYENYYEDQAEYIEATEILETTLKDLGSQEGGETIVAFLDVRDKVSAIHTEFEEAVEGDELEEDTPEYDDAVAERDEALAELKESQPALFSAVMVYREEIESAYQDEKASIAGQQANEMLAYSTVGRIGHVLEPVLRPCGLDWKVSTAMVGAFAAKEVFVAQMGVVYSLGEDEDEESVPLKEKLQANYTPLQGFCIMLFCLISAPCMATIAITKRESNSWGWAMFQLVGLTVLAWVITAAVYQIGSLFA